MSRQDLIKHLKTIFSRRLLIQNGLVILIGLSVFALLNAEFFIKNLRHIKPLPEPPIASLQLGEPHHLYIPSLDIDTPIIYDVADNETAFQTALVNGVVHYPGTALPGEVGNAYIFGHSSDYAWSKGHYKTVFALLPRIAVGARIEVTNATGNPLIFLVTETRIIKKDDLTVLSQETNGQRLLTIQTSYPVGTALQRFIVIAQLTK